MSPEDWPGGRRTGYGCRGPKGLAKVHFQESPEGGGAGKQNLNQLYRPDSPSLIYTAGVGRTYRIEKRSTPNQKLWWRPLLVRGPASFGHATGPALEKEKGLPTRPGRTGPASPLSRLIYNASPRHSKFPSTAGLSRCSVYLP